MAFGFEDDMTVEAEMPRVGFDDATAADQLAARGRTHAGIAMSLGSRTRLYAAAAKVKAHPTRSRPRNFVLSCPATVFIQPNVS